MKFKKYRRVYSLPNAPVLRSVRTQYSVRYHVFTHKINEQLCTFSRQPNFNLVMINYGRLKHWLRKGLSFHHINLTETDQILWPKGLTKLKNYLSEEKKLETSIKKNPVALNKRFKCNTFVTKQGFKP